MKRILMCGAAVIALGLPRGAGATTTSPPVSAFALPMVSAAALDLPGQDQVAVTIVPAGTRYDYSRYRPRRARAYHESYREGYRPPESVTQVHAGFFDPEGDARSGFLVGLRGGLAPDPHIEIGGGLDWRHKSERASEVLSTGPGPGGSEIVTRRELARSSSNLFPFMGYLQLNADRDLGLVPYFGVAAGYEVLFLSAEDFQTGEDFDGTFGGFGWQAWIGAGVPIGPNARFTTEVFMNDAELGRDVEDAVTGQTFRETVDMDGSGMRFGLTWGF
jgi:hypothetical protein